MSSDRDRPRAAGPHNPFPDLHGPAAGSVPSAEEVAAEAAEGERRRLDPRCLVCGHDQFTEEIGKLDTRFGLAAHKVRMLICRRCAFTMQFSIGIGFDV